MCYSFFVNFTVAPLCEERKYMLLELVDIKKSFGEKEVLTGLSFSAEGGRAFGLLGRNGAGKTTSIRILMGVFPADSGKVLIDGAPIDHTKIKIGYLPEERGLYPKKVIIEQLVYFAELHGLSKKDATAACDHWLMRLGMSEYRNKKLEVLSKGNQQKIQLITALSHDPDIIILDEPFSGLDPVNAMLLKEVVKDRIAAGKIVLFSSHQMSYIEEFCDSIAIIKDGKAALSGDLAAIKRNYVRDKLVVSSTNSKEILAAYGERATQLKNGKLIIKLSTPADKSAVMADITSKYEIDEIKVYEPSLNDIFVEYAGDRA